MCLLGLRDGASAVRALAVLAEHLDSVPSPNWQLKLSVTLVPEALMASPGRHRHSVHVVHRLHADKNSQKRKGKFKVFVVWAWHAYAYVCGVCASVHVAAESRHQLSVILCLFL